jgi:hypothetical protein
MWKGGTLGQEYNRELETLNTVSVDDPNTACDTARDTNEHTTDDNPQVSGHIHARKHKISVISTVDILANYGDKDKMANCWL